MITKELFIQSLEHELRVIRHLASKIDISMLSYRPSETQRSLLELLQYMSYVFETSVEAIISKDGTIYRTRSEEASHMTLEQFDEKISSQSKKIRELVTSLTDEQLNEVVDMWSVQPRSLHLLNSTLKWAVAYKMQLFQYLKAGGSLDLKTSNLWVGVDPKN